ncbi:hypothetical protein L0337_41400 [candidate division KSB1 bacterium]|nr:hypothetical protein [candidate division KSB1 bacterium]
MNLISRRPKLAFKKCCNPIFAFLILICVWVKTSGCSHKLPLPPPINTSTPGDGIWRAIGPFGVDVTTIAVAPADPNLLFTATTMGDIYRSDNAGTSWERVATLGTTVRTLNFHQIDPRIVYAGVDLFGVQKTIDGGETWTATGTGLEFDPFVYALAIHPADPNIIFAGTFKSIGTGGVYKSTNGGSNWQASRVGMADEFVLSVAINPNQPNILYAGTFNGRDVLYKSINSGESWTPSNNGLSRTTVFAIVIHPQQSETMYVATGNGIYQSTDGGANWRAMNNGLTNLDVRALIMPPQSPEVLYASGASGIFKTTDGGQSWAPMNSNLFNRVIVKLAVDSANPETVYAGAIGVSNAQSRGSFMGGVFKTTSGGQNWSSASEGLLSADVRAIAIEPRNTFAIYAGTFERGVMSSANGGKDWVSAFEGINLGLDDPRILDLDVDPRAPGTLVAATLAGGIYKSIDGGISWRNVWRSGRVQILARVPANPDILYAAAFSSGVLKSTDGGESWGPTTFDKPGIFALVVDPLAPTTLYAGVNAAEPEGGVYKSTDGGASWQKSSTGMTNPLVRSLAINPQDPKILYAGTLNSRRPPVPPQLFKTTNGGESWEKATELEFEFFVLLVNPRQPEMIYGANLGNGVIKSVDGGGTWSEVKEGLLNPRILALEFDPTDSNILYAGSVGDGIFRVRF